MTPETERLVHEGLPLVPAIARRLIRRLGAVASAVSVDDLVSIGHEALVEAARAYDPARAAFVPYASQRIEWAMRDGIRRETHGRAARARVLALAASDALAAALHERARAAPEGTAIDLAAPGPDEGARLRALLDAHAAALAFGLVSAGEAAELPDPSEGPEEQTARRELAERARRAVAELPDRERILVERHHFAGEPLDAIAADLGISKSWASRLHGQAIAALAERLAPHKSR